MDYKFQNAEIGVMSEIMLPKRILYQGILFQSLEGGLTKFKFQEYFKNVANKKSAEALLENYQDIKDISKLKLDLFDKNYRTIFQGYSMYEVDGVFRYEKEGGIKFDEERTQIIKVYFIPDYELMEKKFPSFSKNEIMNYADLFFSLSKITSTNTEDNIWKRMQPYLDTPDERKSLGLEKKNHKHLYKYFKNWVDAVALFVFGYIIHEICKELIKFKTDLKIDELEKEIWVSSQWGILINRTIIPAKKKPIKN